MARFTVLDRSGEPLRYLGKTITFPTAERARAFCGDACSIAAADAVSACPDDMCETRVPANYRDHYVEGLFAELRRG